MGLCRPPCDCWYFIKTPKMARVSEGSQLVGIICEFSVHFCMDSALRAYLKTLAVRKKCLLTRDKENAGAPSDVGGALPEALFLQPWPNPCRPIICCHGGGPGRLFLPINRTTAAPSFLLVLMMSSPRFLSLSLAWLKLLATVKINFQKNSR